LTGQVQVQKKVRRAKIQKNQQGRRKDQLRNQARVAGVRHQATEEGEPDVKTLDKIIL
jgi:hypothetical protein